MLLGINHTTIVVQDKKSAEDFYVAKLGLEKVVVGKSLWIKVGSQYIHLNENLEMLPQKTFAHFAIAVEGVRMYVQEIIAKGVTVFDLDENGRDIDINQNLSKEHRCFFARDPSGNLVEFLDVHDPFFKQESGESESSSSAPKILSSVKALLCHQGKYLVLREELRKGPIWDLPGGKIEYGESPEEALHREVREELDIAIKIERSIGVWYFFSQHHRYQVICHTFLCIPVGEMHIDTSKNPADEEFTELRWVTREELLEGKETSLHESFQKLMHSFFESTA